MHQPKAHRATRTSYRSLRPSVCPYMLDDIAPTLSEIREARSNQRPAR
jgi:hypothetical protein